MWFSYLFIVALLGALTLQWWLIARQHKQVATHSSAVPEEFADKISLEAHQKAANYTITKLNVTRLELFYGTAILLAWTFGGGLNRYRNGTFAYFDTEKGLSDNFVLALEEDKYGNIWIGTNRGLNCFDQQFFRHFSDRDGIPRGRVLDIYCDPQGTLWIASNDEGLIRYKNGIFTPFKSTGGFANHLIYRILEDHQQNLWLSSEGGIFSVSRRRLNWYMNGGIDFIDWHHFQEGDGLETSVCSG